MKERKKRREYSKKYTLILHPLTCMSPEKQEEKINQLEAELVIKMTKKYTEVQESLNGKSPEERYDVLQRSLRPSTLEIEWQRSLLKIKTVKGHLYVLFLIIAASGVFLLSGKIQSFSELIGVTLFGLLFVVSISLGILLRRASNLRS